MKTMTKWQESDEEQCEQQEKDKNCNRWWWSVSKHAKGCWEEKFNFRPIGGVKESWQCPKNMPKDVLFSKIIFQVIMDVEKHIE